MTSINITFRVDWQSTLLSGSTDSLHHFQGRLTVYITFRVTDKSMFAIRDCHVNALVKRFCMTVYSTFKTTEFYFSINLFSIYTLIFEEKKHVPGRLWPPMCIHSFPVLFDDWLFWQQPFCYIMAVIDNFVDTLKNNNCLMYKWLFGYLLSMSSLICSWNRTARMISL